MLQDEIVDVLDENGKILGQTPKRNAHAQGLLHACVVSEIKDSQGRWTLVKQAPDRQDANQYVSPVGGHVQAGESFDDALKREALEEVGLKDFKYNLMGRIIFNRYVLKRQENHLFIFYEIFSDNEVILNHESVEYRKFTDAEIRQELENNPLIFGDSFAFVVKNFYPHLLK